VSAETNDAGPAEWQEDPDTLADVEDWLSDARAADTKETKKAKSSDLISSNSFLRTERLRPPTEAAFQGRAGQIVDALAPKTEASRTGLLVSLLTMFGNAVGSRPHVQVGAERHRANLFAVLVGPSGSGRKGMAISHAEQVITRADTDWRDRVVRGLVSGEGVIWHVRDPRIELAEDKEKVVEEGVKDKRLLVREDEFASVLAAMARDGSTLSGVLRDCWDGRRLQTLAKNSPTVAREAHVSVLAGITPDELLRKLTATEQANGFANRFLWVYVERSQLRPSGSAIPDSVVRQLGVTISDSLDRARRVDEVVRSNEGNELWSDGYAVLTRDVPGMTGAMRSRAESQSLRLSLIYALLDGEHVIGAQHVEAAFALWDYAERSLFSIFGDALGDPNADRILAALREAPSGLTRTAIAGVFGRNTPASEIERSLALLARAGLAFPTSEDTAGRPVERWRACGDEDEGAP
jgi:hypothetical protein